MDDDSRKAWMKGVVESKRRLRRDGRLHSFTIGSTDKGLGLTYICGHTDEGQVRTYCELKIQEMGAIGWIAVVDTKRAISYDFSFIVSIGDTSIARAS
jgi:hypothetical protein